MKDVRGRLVLITGGARGMGKLTAEKFVEAGARVALVDISDEELSQTADRLRRRGGEVFTYVQDVTDAKGVYALAERVEQEAGPVDVLINNAGIVQAAPFLELPDDRFRLHFEVNVLGLAWFMKAFLPPMIARGEGHVVNMASASGLLGVPYMAAYTATKWAVIGLTWSVRLELEKLGHKGIHVSTIIPSYVSTGMFEGVKAPLLLPFLKPGKMADKIYDAVINDRLYVREPFMVKLAPLLVGALPDGILDQVLDILGITTGVRGWVGHG
jgi:NAD(P)-dependent dehydrogenase (short-subunit alcohol dehydrogenase family)